MQATMNFKTYVNDYYSLPLMNVDAILKKNGARTCTITGELTRYGHSLMPLEIAKDLERSYIKN